MPFAEIPHPTGDATPLASRFRGSAPAAGDRGATEIAAGPLALGPGFCCNRCVLRAVRSGRPTLPARSLTLMSQDTTPTRYRFSFGPWNISTGADPFGPPV